MQINKITGPDRFYPRGIKEVEALKQINPAFTGNTGTQ